MPDGNRRVVVVGDSVAGVTALRELRALGHTGPVALIAADPDGCYPRPPLSKKALVDAAGDPEGWSLADLEVDVTRSAAVGLDSERRIVHTEGGHSVHYDALVLATGARARRLAPEREGEFVVRTMRDATALRERLSAASSVAVIGAGFLGLEVAGAAHRRGLPVTVVDTEPPLMRMLGPFLSEAVAARLRAASVDVVRATSPAVPSGDPIEGITVDGVDIRADVVVSCVGEVPNCEWLSGTALADPRGIAVDERCATSVPDVFAAGDVTHRRGADGTRGRNPFWSHAVAQAKVAAAGALGLEPRCAPHDDYFWTDILGAPVKIVGPLPLVGEPTRIAGSLEDASAVLEWDHEDGRRTVVAFGAKKAVGWLRRRAADAE
ncbi:FAD-dependent oxidoreductase [Rhodococcus corynebacterioides]|uniref:FAD-dependent oxidoreductase n=1 Tax=Rhodococcoides corynebacterioides TaxID=53972 RepID=A0ABS7P0I2_9NOCA|nr:FAD-dependent oxidoreductase [Rhodococcus corynebacterioides]MBY6406641.1 FAD-dependent oxidoreductase [Rhodococcus corynebacterioides]